MLGKHFVMMRSPNRISAFLFQNADDRSDTVSWRILQQDMYMVFITFFSRNPPCTEWKGTFIPSGRLRNPSSSLSMQPS